MIIKILFWICWGAEMAGTIWWIVSELMLQYIKPGPYSYIAFIYLLVALYMRFGTHAAISNTMVFVPAVPLLLLGLMLVIAMTSGGRMN